jgi:hypothetical protein
MSVVFDALPGVEVMPDAIARGLAQLWARESSEAVGAVEDVRATQLNLVLHLGFGTTPEDGCTQFDTALHFARRYPCRVVVLCPLRDDSGANGLRAKIYGECFLGRAKGDTRCVEFVALSYPRSARAFLENAVSVCLSADLPLYYWAHRFTFSSKLADYQYLLRTSQRFILDSALVPQDALTHPWPRPEAVRDLAMARLLPVRQSIGQFLAGTAPATLIAGLDGFDVEAHPSLQAEGHALARWARERLAACGAPSTVISGRVKVAESGEERGLALAFRYRNGQQFRWQGDLRSGHGAFSAQLGGAAVTLPTMVSLLPPDVALAEAMFF